MSSYEKGNWTTRGQDNLRTSYIISYKTRTPLKFAGVHQSRQPVSAVSGRKFTILRDVHLEEILLFNKFFPIVYTCLSCLDIAGESCAMVSRWRFFGDFLRPVFSASLVRHISDMHSKFTLRPHHVWKYGRHPIEKLGSLYLYRKKTVCTKIHLGILKSPQPGSV